jgi:hypothetical protein
MMGFALCGCPLSDLRVPSNTGLAYMDNTPQEQMQAERMERVESMNRNNPIKDNLERFKASPALHVICLVRMGR